MTIVEKTKLNTNTKIIQELFFHQNDFLRAEWGSRDAQSAGASQKPLRGNEWKLHARGLILLSFNETTKHKLSDNVVYNRLLEGSKLSFKGDIQGWHVYSLSLSLTWQAFRVVTTWGCSHKETPPNLYSTTILPSKGKTKSDYDIYTTCQNEKRKQQPPVSV